jgi:cell wall-associated NlpC family hydrolase
METFAGSVKCAVSLVALAYALGYASKSVPDKLQPITRDELISRARELSTHEWIVSHSNTVAACYSKYRSRFKVGEHIVGLPYAWGKMTDVATFDLNLTHGFAAGAHKQDGVLSCAAGIDCSGFVSYCWGQPITRKYGTATLRQIAGRPRYNWYSDMQPGDALVRPGDHVVLFAGYRPDGNPNVYEASGSESRVIFNTKSTWARFKGYYPLEYKMIQEP